MNYTIEEIFKVIGRLVCWGLAIILGITVFLTVAEGLVAFASTGIGAIILVVIAWKLYKRYYANNE